MSLIISAPKQSNFTPIQDGTYLGVCCMIVDLGMIYNETYKKSQRKVMIGWQLPDEQIEVNGKMEPRVVTNRYTATLGQQGNLYRDLITWRGQEFTPEELDAFNLANIIGKSCLLTITNSKAADGKTYTNVSGVARLMKGMEKGELKGEPLIFDLDSATLDDVDNLPHWIGDQVKKSQTYQEKLDRADEESITPPAFTDLDDGDGDLPF